MGKRIKSADGPRLGSLGIRFIPSTHFPAICSYDYLYFGDEHVCVGHHEFNQYKTGLLVINLVKRVKWWCLGDLQVDIKVVLMYGREIVLMYGLEAFDCAG